MEVKPIMLIGGVCIFFITIYIICYFTSWRENEVESFSNVPGVDKILTGMLKNPKQTANMFTNLLGTKSDLGYYDSRSEGKLKELKQELFSKDDMEKLKVPLPEFEDLENKNDGSDSIKSKKKKANNKSQKKVKKTESKPKPKKKKKAIKDKTVNYQDICRFVGSTSKYARCPKNYPVFVGAEFSGKNIQCQGISNKNTKSKVKYCKLCCKNEI